MRTIICGGRDGSMQIEDWRWLDLQRVELPISEVVEGGADGVDMHARLWGMSRGVPVTTMWAIWRPGGKLDRSAGHKRNARMAKYAEACIVFPGGNGTAGMMKAATTAGLKVIER